MREPRRSEPRFHGLEFVAQPIVLGTQEVFVSASIGIVLYPRDGDDLEVLTPQGRFDLTLVDPFHYEPADAMLDARLTALMPGRVVKVLAAEGEAVKKGQALMILEAMKMEHALTAPHAGIVTEVAVAAGSQVAEGDRIVVIEATE